MNNAATTTDIDTTVVETQNSAPQKRRGAKPNPNSKYNLAKNIMLSLPKDKLNRKDVLAILENDLGLSKATASVYYHTIVKTIK